MYNPRFPHTLKVLTPVLDGDGNVVFDEKGDMTYEPITLQVVVMFDDDPMIRTDGTFETEEATAIAFGYRTASENTRTTGDVVVSDYKLACPMFITPLLSGDIVELTDYDRTYRATVVKKANSNWGSNIWVNEVKN